MINKIYVTFLTFVFWLSCTWSVKKQTMGKIYKKHKLLQIKLSYHQPCHGTRRETYKQLEITVYPWHSLHMMPRESITISDKWAASWQNQQNGMCAQPKSSLGIKFSSLSAWRKPGSLATHWAHSEDSDQTGWLPRLIWVFAGCTVILLVCHEAAQMLRYPQEETKHYRYMEINTQSIYAGCRISKGGGHSF